MTSHDAASTWDELLELLEAELDAEPDVRGAGTPDWVPPNIPALPEHQVPRAQAVLDGLAARSDELGRRRSKVVDQMAHMAHARRPASDREPVGKIDMRG